MTAEKLLLYIAITMSTSFFILILDDHAQYTYDVASFVLIPFTTVTGSRCIDVRACGDCVAFAFAPHAFYALNVVHVALLRQVQSVVVQATLSIATMCMMFRVFALEFPSSPHLHAAQESTSPHDEEQAVGAQTTTTSSIDGAATSSLATPLDPPESSDARVHCVICLEHICLDKPENAPLALPCAHVFHTSCIRRWMRVRETCPSCNTAITVSN